MVEDSITVHTIIMAPLISVLEYSLSDNVALFWIICLDTVAKSNQNFSVNLLS